MKFDKTLKLLKLVPESSLTLILMDTWSDLGVCVWGGGGGRGGHLD